MTDEMNAEQLAKIKAQLAEKDEQVLGLERDRAQHERNLKTHQTDISHWRSKETAISKEMTELKRKVAADLSKLPENATPTSQMEADKAKLDTLEQEYETAGVQRAASETRAGEEEAFIRGINQQIEGICAVVNLVLVPFDDWTDLLDDQVGDHLQQYHARSEPVGDAGVFVKIGGLEMVGLNEEKPKLSNISGVRLDSAELEYRISALMDHLTTRRIAEEMDTASYLARLEEFIGRAKARADELANGPINRLGQEITEKLNTIDKHRIALMTLPAELQSDAMQRVVNQRNTSNFKRIEEMKDKLNAIDLARQDVKKRLREFTAKLLGGENTARTKQTASHVSEVVEKSLVLKPWPFLVGAVAAIGAKFGLALQSSLLIAQNDGKIVSAVFLGAYLISIWLGKRYRNQIMKRVHIAYRKSIEALFAEEWDTHQPLQFKQHSLSGEKLGSWFKATPGKRTARLTPMITMLAINSFVMLLPALPTILAVFGVQGVSDTVYRQLNWQTYTFIGANADGAPCTIQKGHITHMDSEHYYILPFVENSPEDDSLARRVLPEFYAQVIPARTVKLIRTKDGDGAKAVENCLLDRPKNPNPKSEPSIVFDFTDLTVEILPNSVEPGLTEVQVESRVHRALEQARDHTHTVELARIADALMRPIEQPRRKPSVLNTYLTTNIEVPEIPETKETSIWEYRLFLDQQEVLSAPDTQVLFFFPSGVRGTENSPEGAYRRGFESYDIARQDGAPYREFLEVQMQHLIRSLGQRLEQREGELSLTIEGFASLQWEAEIDSKHRDELNHALAEGRRQAVVIQLKDGLGTLANRVWLSGGSKGDCTRLSMVAFKDWQTLKNRQFDAPNQMIQARKRLIASLKDPTSAELAEFTRRSVVVRAGDGRTRCGADKIAMEK